MQANRTGNPLPSLLENRSEVSSRTVIDRAEELQLGWAILNDNCHNSRERMVAAHRHMVGSIASKYMGRGRALTDLCDLGTVGLLRAVENFDPAQGARFSTLASWWIKQSIKHGLRTGSTPQTAACRRESRGAERSTFSQSRDVESRREPVFARLEASLSTLLKHPQEITK